ncbi:basic form of pathogenesis-related protein 1-like protein [Tanacetum coccineum]
MELFRIKSVAIFLVILSCHTYNSLARRVRYHQDLASEFLVPHNEARAQVGVEPLTWNYSLAAYAHRYAYHMLGSCDLRHSEGPFGENLAEGYGNQFSCNEAVNLWVGEKEYYDYDSNSCVGDECRHYTQVVWRDSVHLGCAKLMCRNGWWFVICSYDPPGNYEGERPY